MENLKFYDDANSVHLSYDDLNELSKQLQDAGDLSATTPDDFGVAMYTLDRPSMRSVLAIYDALGYDVYTWMAFAAQKREDA